MPSIKDQSTVNAIAYTHNHKLDDNGHGDWNLMCNGEKVRFIPRFSYHGLKTCDKCGMDIEEVK